MLEAMSEVVSECLGHAERARFNAAAATSDGDREFWCEIETMYVTLAESCQRGERIHRFITSEEADRPRSSTADDQTFN